MQYVYVDEERRRNELEKLTKEELITQILDHEERMEDMRYEAMGEDL